MNQLEILKFIPYEYYGSNVYDQHEFKNVKEVIDSKAPFRYSRKEGIKAADQFEEKCKNYFGVSYAHCVNSGMGALSCALHALNIGIGDEVIMPGYFFVADVNAVVLHGAKPVLCEVDNSFCIDADKLENKITSKTKCIIMIHMDGSYGNIEKIMKVAKKYDLLVLEDFSQAIGATYNGKKIGSFGDIAVCSFQQNKMITAGEGGLILTNNEKLYYAARSRADCGLDRGNDSNAPEEFITFGEGRRMSEISAAVLNAQIDKLDSILLETRTNAKAIFDLVQTIPNGAFREYIQSSGATGTTITIIFNSNKDLDKFFEKMVEKFPSGEFPFYRIENTGYHIYYECPNLVKKVEALPGGFPWCFYEKDLCYEKGTLPYTDELIRRACACHIPACMTSLQANTLGEGIREVLDSIK